MRISKSTPIYFIVVVFLDICLFSMLSCVEESVYYDQLRIRGNKEFYPYEKFQGIRYENASQLGYFGITKMEFDPETLIKALGACPSLNRIELNNVVWRGSFRKKLHFPQLTKIEIRRTKWRFAESTVEEFLDILFFITPDTRKEDLSIVFRAELGGSFIYFMETLHVTDIPYDVQQYFSYKTLEVEHSIVDVSKFSGKGLKSVSIVNSTLLNGPTTHLLQKFTNVTSLTLLNVVEQDGSLPNYDLKFLQIENLVLLSLQGGKLHYSSGLPPVTFRDLKKLKLINVVLNTSGIVFPQKILTSVDFHNVVLTGGFEFIGELTSLRQVSLNESSSGKKTNFDISLLSNSGETISSLTLINLKVTMTKKIQFKRLNDLELERCQFVTPLLQDLSHVFQNTETVYFDNQLTDPILEGFLNTSATEFMISNVGEIGKENVGVKRFLKEANTSALADRVRIVKRSDGKWEYAGSHPEDIEKGESRIFYSYMSILFVVCFLGLVGNVISIIVLAGKVMWSSTSCILITLALFDSTILLATIGSLPLYGFKLVSLFLNIFTFPFGLFSSGSHIAFLGNSPLGTVTFLEDIQAKFIYPLCKTAHTGSVYITVLLTLERFLAVCFPLKIRFWTSKRKAVGMSLVILLIAVVLNFPRWFETKGSTIKVLHKRNPERLILIEPVLERVYNEPNILQERAYRVYYHGWLWAVVMYVLPIPTLCFLNGKIWLRIRHSVSQRRSISTSATENDAASLTIMLLCVSLVFILCNSVNGCIIWIFVSYGSYDPRDIEVFSCIPLILNSSTNFIIYCLLGKKFRGELFRIFKCSGLGCFGKYSEQQNRSVALTMLTKSTLSSRNDNDINSSQSPM